ncbi:Spore coat protein A [Roseovarius litorisediminis]|uniref:Spore coat protein A n=1 Tax=Roseovarius litorisediminis TaxID=1312363 RepID=A0A1Y5STL1_9RHOB|nr:multicopper oxidase domain-containing protein [Roseovarius litorisediminis]SLN47820.1 Spore coat protein A [Roseovarius litorisediminis]
MKRREALKLGLGTAGAGLVASQAGADVVDDNREIIDQWGTNPTQSGLVFPDNFEPSIKASPSPAVEPFTAPLNIMPVAQPLDINPATGEPDFLYGDPVEPARHQRFDDFPPQKYYEEVLGEFRWKYHWQPPYGDGTPGVVGKGGDPNVGSWHWGFNGITPGETYHARYGEPVFLRRNNELPPVGSGHVNFALPSPTIHLHNAHTASESDGIPQDFFNPGEFWDHHYANFPAGSPNGHGPHNREIMNTLWYHDHRLDFTATNVYAGFSGFYLIFDERDSGDETDPNPLAFNLPSGDYDIPLIMHDVQFTPEGQVIWDFFTPSPATKAPHDVGNLDGRPDTFEPLRRQYTTNGMTGDKITVNRIIQPYLDVDRRKYRFRFLNGGPSRLYQLVLRIVPADGSDPYFDDWTVLSNDGNLLEEPIQEPMLEIWVANRNDVIVDFSKYAEGDKIQVMNQMEIRPDGAGPTGYTLEGDNLMPVIQFNCKPGEVADPSKVPAKMRKLPKIRMSEVRRKRLFVFDYDNGLWTVNGRLMDPNRVDVKIEQGSAEIWTFRNEGSNWAHPVHTHFEEFQILEVNGRPPSPFETSRKDVVSLGPGDEVTFFSRWRDFFGKHVMHCHNVVHEDHAMMIRWDIVPVGQGD